MSLRTFTPAELATILASHKAWRRGMEGSRANLAGAYLTRAYLTGANLAGANLAGAYLAGANLAGAYLTDANLAGANLAGANLAGANLTGADLTDAYLTRAYLTRAYLTDANLTDANLAGANLAGAYLAGAYLTGAYLTDANLAGADLAGANLTGANLTDANLAGANLTGANLTDADLTDAYLTGANLTDADLGLPGSTEPVIPPAPYARKLPTPEVLAERAKAYRERNPSVPVVEALDAKLLEAVTAKGGRLEMSSWHTCDTTHCRAGWAVHLAGDVGYELECKLGSQGAGAAIYRASTGRVPHFFATNERALEDIKACAAAQGEATS